MSLDLPVVPDLRMDLVPPDVGAAVEAATLIADHNRAAILAILRGGAHCVCEMAAALDERQNNVSNHLARLRDAGLVRTVRASADSRRVYYERDEEACEAASAELRRVLEPGR
ncbi:MAG: metalloregulator ArsR/SmtB family transcription factor [Chloroflexi bacterium]|nr:metalloregulator ArsR/SmtB family transcription factor [Chloroflexota bacterium]